MKKNTKGFTLIELLAVIVILAIIMVVAVPQILNVITSSRKSAWESNIKLIEEAVELNDSIYQVKPVTGASLVVSQEGCTSANIGKVVDTDITQQTIDSTTYSSSTGCRFTVTPTSSGNFSGQNAVTITCSSSKCSH